MLFQKQGVKMGLLFPNDMKDILMFNQLPT